MTQNEGIHRYEPLWEEWKVEEPIGVGSYGKVYKISKQLGDGKVVSAVKHITIPTRDQYEDAVLSLGHNRNTLNKYFKDVVNKIENEIRVLYQLRGNTNIVNYEDYMIKTREDIGWDVLIKMEYVTPLNKLLEVKDFTKEMALNLGIDICSGLKLCHDNGIIHRDIKDSNIFISPNNSFKIGDFGVATNLSSEEAMTRIGTPYYMAPEIILNSNNEVYNKTVDIYSLGIVLYRLFNKLKFPFVPLDEEQITYNTKEMAQAKRVNGEILPKPYDADENVWRIIKKACAHNPQDRYSNVEDLKFDLQSQLRNMSKEEKEEVLIKATGISGKNPHFMNENKKGIEKDTPEPNDDTVLIDNSENETVLLERDNEDTVLLEDRNVRELKQDDTIKTTKNKKSKLLKICVGAAAMAAIISIGVISNNYLNRETGLSAKLQNNKWVYQDKKGNIAIEAKYDEAYDFSDGLALVKINGKYGFIDEKGYLAIYPNFDNAWEFNNGKAEVIVGGERYYINTNGERVINQ